MKRRFINEQIIGILKENEAGVQVKDLCRKHGMSDATYYKWKSKFAGMEVSDARRLRDIEDQNSRLKKLVADLSLHKMALEALVKKDLSPKDFCKAVDILQALGLRERHSCRLIGAARSTIRYQSVNSPDTDLRSRIKELADKHSRFGHPRLHVLLRREGFGAMTHRIYTEEGLQVRKRRMKRRCAIRRQPLILPSKPLQRWSMDFMRDQLASGRRIRTFNVIDDFTK